MPKIVETEASANSPAPALDRMNELRAQVIQHRLIDVGSQNAE